MYLNILFKTLPFGWPGLLDSVCSVLTILKKMVMKKRRNSIDNQALLQAFFCFQGFLLFYPETTNFCVEKAKIPVIVMIHENKGLNDYIKDSANILAKSGYVVLAVDLFNGEIVTNNQTRSGELTG
jgi:hypothetical protein